MSGRQEYIDRVQRKLAEWDDEIDRLEVKAREANEVLRQQWAGRRLEFEERRAELRRRLEALRAEADDAWAEMKQGVEDTREAVARSVREMKDKLLG